MADYIGSYKVLQQGRWQPTYVATKLKAKTLANHIVDVDLLWDDTGAGRLRASYLVSQKSKLNCEVLLDELAFEVRWAVAGDSIVLQLVAKLEDGEYMAFGISGDPAHSQMVGGDVAVSWVDKATLKGYAVDYYLDAKSQCAGVRGSCPDERLGENTNSVRLLNAALVNGYSIVTYQRPLRAADELDLPVLTNASQPVIWAVGPLNSLSEVSYHHHYNKVDKFIEFGRPPVWNCPMPEGEDDQRPTEPPKSKPVTVTNNNAVIRPNPVPTPAPVPRVTPWEIPAVQCYEPADGVFYAQMGPTGGKQGYSAITGHVGWGISWYINGLLIPEINVVRGKKYTFVVEGGSDPEVPARYHPFYITNDPVGGYFHRSEKERQGVEIYAGVRRSRNGELFPTGVGRSCNWTPDPEGPGSDEYPSFGAYQRSLTLVCEEGNPGVITWTPDKNTPDTVYYQCFTHRHLGWKINVVDECDESEAEESRAVESFALPDDLQQEESIQVQTRIKPDTNFLDQRTKFEKIINSKNNYDDFSSNRQGDDGFQGDAKFQPEPERNQLYAYGQEYELPVSKVQIKEVIEAVESIENKMRGNILKNTTHQPIKPFSQYQVHEDVKEFFVPEQPVREGDEYVVETGTVPDNHLLPPHLTPLTLQSVLRPNAPNGKPVEKLRAPFRRPIPPEIKLQRPMFQKVNNIYPLPLPNHHGPYGMLKKPQQKYPPYRRNPNINRFAHSGVPPMKFMPGVPHNKPGFHHMPPKQIQKMPSYPNQPIVMGNPVNKVPLLSQAQTLNLDHTDVIANQVVKSQITLPQPNDVIAQNSAPQIFVQKPGQIILGRPMEYPVPLDQQMMSTKTHTVRTTPIPAPVVSSTTLRINFDTEQKNDLISSDFIGQSTDDSVIPPAVNTGFKPDSVVVESGFRPIIREPLMAEEDRITDDSGINTNRREDTDVEEDYDEAPQQIQNQVNNNDRIPSDKITEAFEPIFIPSPPDMMTVQDKTKEVFPHNHAKEHRPHPIYVRTESELNALFSKKNIEKNVPADIVMESNRLSAHYLPPDPKFPKEYSQKFLTSEETFTTYDGKTVSAATLTSVPEVKKINKLISSKLPGSSEDLLKTPQFGPFTGKTPPLTDEAKGNTTGVQTTVLKLVNHSVSSYAKTDPESEENDESPVTEEITSTLSDTDNDEYEEEFEEEEESTRRRRRETNNLEISLVK